MIAARMEVERTAIIKIAKNSLVVAITNGTLVSMTLNLTIKGNHLNRLALEKSFSFLHDRIKKNLDFPEGLNYIIYQIAAEAARAIASG